MTNETNETLPRDLETLNIVQQVLRLTVVSLAAACHADMAKLGYLLQAAATHDVHPLARQMLLDLAEGPDMISLLGLKEGPH